MQEALDLVKCLAETLSLFILHSGSESLRLIDRLLERELRETICFGTSQRDICSLEPNVGKHFTMSFYVLYFHSRFGFFSLPSTLSLAWFFHSTTYIALQVI
jgi:hypothetical protein